MKSFYYVYNRAQDKPLHRHKDKDSAIKEAIRLSKQEKKNFYVLAPVGHIKWMRKEEVCFLDIPESDTVEN